MAVFVSHSKHDQEIVKYFSQIFAHIGLKAKFMEWEDLTNKYAGKEISDIIRGKWLGESVSATFVLLGYGLQNPPTMTPQFTHNWVNFEVGVTVGSQKPVWIFEDVNHFINFPIPYVTDYCQYVLDNIEDLKGIAEIIQRRIMMRNYNFLPPYRVKCPNENCHAEYNYWSNRKLINCPVCRQGIQFN